MRAECIEFFDTKSGGAYFNELENWNSGSTGTLFDSTMVSAGASPSAGAAVGGGFHPGRTFTKLSAV